MQLFNITLAEGASRLYPNCMFGEETRSMEARLQPFDVIELGRGTMSFTTADGLRRVRRTYPGELIALPTCEARHAASMQNVRALRQAPELRRYAAQDLVRELVTEFASEEVRRMLA